MINRRTFTLFSMCTAVGVSGLANAQADKKPKILVVYFSYSFFPTSVVER